MTTKSLVWLLATLALAGPPAGTVIPRLGSVQAAPALPTRAEDARPLPLGAVAPTAKLDDAAGNSVDLAKVFRQQPTVVVFYRGGWCPFCNQHLADLAKLLPDLQELGFRVLAISPDRPSELQKTVAKNNLTYTLLSDKSGALTRAFGLAYQVDADTLTALKGHGVDLEAVSGNGRHELPVPAVYLINAKGTITFAHSNPDYKVRLPADELLAAARKVAAK